VLSRRCVSNRNIDPCDDDDAKSGEYDLAINDLLIVFVDSAGDGMERDFVMKPAQ
jgi:hypothetical protein